MKNIKSMISANLFFILVLLLITVSGVFSFFLASDDTENEFTVQSLKTSLVDEFSDYEKLEEGSTYPKLVAVKNESDISCYVRVFAEIKDEDAREAVSANFNSSFWEKGDDGYWYYKDVLLSGEETEPLFTELAASKNVVNFEMICYQEAKDTPFSYTPLKGEK